MDDAQRRFLDRGAAMIPDLVERVCASGHSAEYLLGERTTDGVTVRLTLQARIVLGTGNPSSRPVTVGGRSREGD